MNAEEILSVTERETRPVGSLFVRSLTAGESLDLEDAIRGAGDDKTKLLAVQISAFLSDESGSSVLTPEQAVEFVRKRKASTIKDVIETAQRLNGVGEDLKGN